jgi:Baseplate J-like protein
MTCSCGCATACGELPTRFPITNPSGLSQLAYRVGTFATFRRALLQSLDGETELAAWKPTASRDLGLQLIDWWAYIADILTFYNERIANEDYLGTARLDTSVAHLVSLLGYRPRPGIGAVGTLAVIASAPGPLIVPSGLAVASKATPAVESQTFETTQATTFTEPTSVPGPAPDDLSTPPPLDGPPATEPGAAQVAPHQQLIARGGVLVKGTPSSISVGDRLLLIPTNWTSSDDPHSAAVVQVTGLAPEPDPHGRKNTRVLLDGAGRLPGGADASTYRLAYATRAAHLSTLPPKAAVITFVTDPTTNAAADTIVLDGPARYLKTGDPLLVQTPGAGTGPSPGAGFDLVQLTGYAEALWYANAPDPTQPATFPANGNPPGVPIIVSRLTVDPVAGNDLTHFGATNDKTTTVTVYGGWRDVGALLNTPVQTLTALPGTLMLAAKPAAAAGAPTAALLEDANGAGAAVTAVVAADSTAVAISGTDTTLMAPLRILWDLITITRGATVRNELLGSGDASQPGQDFTLSKKPVTFLADYPGRSADGYSCALTVSVDDRYWTEVPTLYGHGPDETVFETYNDDSGSTHVRTGDGQTGRRLPSGARIVATYRTGSGAAVPPAGSLSQVLTAVPNLRSVRNPVPPGGGSDPDPADRIRSLAPQTVLTFGRAISGEDYAAVAAAAPGVTRAAAAWEWDPTEQRPMVRVYVGDDPTAVDSATSALRAQADPNRPLVVLPAVRCDTVLTVIPQIDPSYVPDAVREEIRAAVSDNIFAPGVLALGQPLYRSRIEEVVTAVPGVIGIDDLVMSWSIADGSQTSRGPRFNPGPGGFFALRQLALSELPFLFLHNIFALSKELVL